MDTLRIMIYVMVGACIAAIVVGGITLENIKQEKQSEVETDASDSETSIRKMVIPGDGVVCYILQGGDASGISCVPLNETGLGSGSPAPAPEDRPPQYAVENGGVA
jgi:hypothetical protein